MTSRERQGPDRTLPARALVVIAGCLAVLAGLAVAVSDQRYLTGEVAVLEALNDVPTVVGLPFRAVMQLGTIVAAGLLVGAVAAWTRSWRATAAVALAGAVAFRLDNLLKDVIDRPRPPAVLDGLHVRETIDGFGFPSGHTTMAFALAAALQPTVPARWRWVPWALAVVVGLARMHVGVHWPADVAGGAALGTAIGTAAALAATAAATHPTRTCERQSQPG